jgi:hypothetical protein
VALATAGRLPDGMADSSGLIAALGEAGVTGALVGWDDAEVDWRDFDLVVPHCPWDYLERRAEFFGWLAELDQRGKLPNSHRLLCWNVDKSYLLELRDHGIAIPETMIFEAGEQVRSGPVEQFLGSGPLVVKPAVGALLNQVPSASYSGFHYIRLHGTSSDDRTRLLHPDHVGRRTTPRLRDRGRRGGAVRWASRVEDRFPVWGAGSTGR